MIKNIIFTGGGLKGWAYIGTLRALDEYIDFKQIEQVIGVSVGSLFGLCYILGIPWDFLLEYIMDLNIKEYLDINLDTLLTNQSFLEGIKFTEILKKIISTKIPPDITFKELGYYTNVLFTVNALNVTEQKLEYFNSKLTPDIKVIDAIRASCNLPFFFPPYKIGNCFYYDGGICNNCPIDLVDELFTIAFDISHESDTLGSKLIDLLYCLIHMTNKLHYKKNADNIYKILDESFKDEMANVHQSRDTIFTIYMNGYINSKELLFTNHVAIK
jgi:predicted acylesterase/phospholipase RssA